MRIVCSASEDDHSSLQADVAVALFAKASPKNVGRAGFAISERIRKEKLAPTARAWDVLSLALAVVSADLAGHRSRSPDGWTRQFEVFVTVSDASFWNSQRETLERLLRFLTTDVWKIEFLPNGFTPAPSSPAARPTEGSVVLLSGGLDSLVGAIDLVAAGITPIVVSHIVKGDAAKQVQFAAGMAGGLRHIQLNHNADVPNPEAPPSQRARAIVFFAYGVLIATTLERYHDGGVIDLYVCENGFIGVNSPLTDARVGSLSTRTTHPIVLALFQKVLDAADLRVRINNPYRYKTKGEMLAECKDQALLARLAHQSTSCGRFLRFGHKHCGRCVPCLIRRAAFLKWGRDDATPYKYKKLSINNTDHMRFDDVRSARMAVAVADQVGVDRWIGASLSSPLIADYGPLRDMVERGLDELRAFLAAANVQ